MAATGVSGTSTSAPRAEHGGGVAVPSSAEAVEGGEALERRRDRRAWLAAVLGLVALGVPLALPAGVVAVGVQGACLAALLVLLGTFARERRSANDRLFLLLFAVAALATAAGAAPALLGRGRIGGAELPLALAGTVAAIAILGLTLEARFARVASAELRALMAGLPRSAIVVRPEGEIETDIERVRAGEEILVPVGETVPVDGVVRTGQASVMPLWGRTETAEIGPGNLVIAGARVTRGELRLTATFVGAERTLARVTRLGLGQEARPAAIVRWSARAGLVANAVGLAAGIVVGGLTLVQGEPLPMALATGSAMLLALCGRALERASALPMAAGAARAARSGAFFRDAAAIETTGRVGTVVLPVRGTLTEGAPHVTDLETVGDRADPVELLALAAAASIAAAPDHPVTAGLRSAAAERGAALPEVRRPAHRPGRGVLGAAPGGEDFVVGSRALLLAEGVSVAAADETVTALEERGRTTVLVAVGGRVQGVVGLYDAARAGTRQAIDALHALRVEPVILTGDSRTTTEALARDFGIDHVRAEVEPDQRAAEVRRLTEAGTTVAVIGNPARDGAALDAADVAIALRSAAMPHGEPAVRLVGDSLTDAVAAVAAGRGAMAGARRNLTIASGALILGAILALGGLLPPPAAALLSVITSVSMGRTPRDRR